MTLVSSPLSSFLLGKAQKDGENLDDYTERCETLLVKVHHHDTSRLRCVALRCVAWRGVAWRGVAFRCIALYCVVLVVLVLICVTVSTHSQQHDIVRYPFDSFLFLSE